MRLPRTLILTLGRLAEIVPVAIVLGSHALLAQPTPQPTAQPTAQPTPQSCAPARTALVLSGGAAKGFAHIGVLQVLDSIGVKPDLIVGTSVGAMIGSLYASGYSARAVDSLMRALPFESVIRQYEPKVSSALGLLRPLAVWERGRTGYRLQTGAAREGEVNALISALTLRGNLVARGRFDSLPIPFRAVATNLVTRRPVVMGTGDLAWAVRASVALPVMFQPLRSDSSWLIDGAMSDNTPIAQARALGAERVWASRLPYAPPDRNAFDDPLTLFESLVNTLFKEDSTAARPGDVNIINPTYTFEALDFRRATSDSLIMLGHETARAAFAAADCVRPMSSVNGANRGAAGNAGETGAGMHPALPTRVGSVTMRNPVPDGPAVLTGLGIASGRAIDLRRTEKAYGELGHSERVRAVWLNPGGTGAEVTFRPELEPASRRLFGVGVAFDQFMSGRLWVGGVDHSVFGANAEGAVVARFGSYEQDALGFLRLHTDLRGGHLPVTVGGRLAHESVRLFKGSGELPSAETNEGEGFIGLHDDPAAGAWRYEAMMDARVWREPGRNTRGSVGLRAALFRARDEYEMGTITEVIALTDYQRVRVDASRAIDLGSTQFRFRARVGWGNRLPVQQTFSLGGSDGFAGLRIGDIRGNQEAYAALQLKRGIVPQLRFVVEGMAGAVGDGYGFLARRDSTEMGRVYAGVRAGFEASTPIGPIRVEEGINHLGARVLLVRVGYWF